MGFPLSLAGTGAGWWQAHVHQLSLLMLQPYSWHQCPLSPRSLSAVTQPRGAPTPGAPSPPAAAPESLSRTAAHSVTKHPARMLAGPGVRIALPPRTRKGTCRGWAGDLKLEGGAGQGKEGPPHRTHIRNSRNVPRPGPASPLSQSKQLVREGAGVEQAGPLPQVPRVLPIPNIHSADLQDPSPRPHLRAAVRS